MYQIVLFDLDGTLTDSGLGITNAVAYALEKFGIHEEDHSKLNVFVGPSLKDSFTRYYGLSSEDCERGIAYYREYYQDKGLLENEVYPGIPGLLKYLKETGRKVILATSKPEFFTSQIMEHFHLDQYFDLITGASMDEKRVEKADVIRYALEKAGITDVTNTVMVGDREYDILGAKENGLDSIGVLYGYGSREELEAAGAGQIAETVEELWKILRQNSVTKGNLT